MVEQALMKLELVLAPVEELAQGEAPVEELVVRAEWLVGVGDLRFEERELPEPLELFALAQPPQFQESLSCDPVVQTSHPTIHILRLKAFS